MRGEKVIVRIYGGATIERIIWEETDRRVYVTSEDNFEKLKRGQWEALPIGFPRSDIIIDSQRLSSEPSA